MLLENVKGSIGYSLSLLVKNKTKNKLNTTLNTYFKGCK